MSLEISTETSPNEEPIDFTKSFDQALRAAEEQVLSVAENGNLDDPVADYTKDCFIRGKHPGFDIPEAVQEYRNWAELNREKLNTVFRAASFLI